MERLRSLAVLQQQDVPESLKFWTQDFGKKSLSWDQVARQVYDLYSLPDETWSLFQALEGNVSPSLDHFVREAQAFRQLNSKESVGKYFQAELLNNQDPYFMIDKISMPGAGIRGFYDRLLTMANLTDLTVEERSSVLSMLGHWEEAAVEVICDPELFFTKTATGNEGTISEFFGSMIASDVDIINSPNMKDGRYKDRFRGALDYEGIIDGKYKRVEYDLFSRQEMLLRLLYVSQGQNDRFSHDFWRAIEANEDFIFTAHGIAVKEGYSDVNELLIRAIDYAWRKSQDDGLHYDWVSHHILDEHFEGKTAAEKFLADPLMRFEEIFAGSGTNVQQDYLWDYRRVNEDSRDMVVLLDWTQNGESITARYGHVGESYSEGTISINSGSKVTIGLEGEIEMTIHKMVCEFEVFRRNYLKKLNKWIE